MELQYQTHRNVDINKQLNRLDKINSKLALTVKDLPSSNLLPQNTKDRILTLITNDQAAALLKFLHKQVISWDKEAGAKGTQWNILHVCSKFNAVSCLKAMLKKIYQLDQQQYRIAVNSKTAEGFTLLMIAIIYRADNILVLLLQLGGVDLSIIQKGKMRAYDLALHYRNQFAISNLIFYEDRCRKAPFINHQQLASPDPLLQEKPTICEEITTYLIDCFICFKNDEGEQENDEKMMAKGQGKKEREPVDLVKVGSRRDIEDYDIQWMKLSMMNGQKVTLFDSFKPQDICENQFSLKNILILLQTLSDFPWILRAAITKLDRGGTCQRYNVLLYHNGHSQKVEVDDCVPTIKQRGQPMFISNRNEIWPMILQKGLAKVYGSYLSLNTVPPSELMESITGFYMKEIPIKQINQGNGFVSAFQELALRGYIVLLQGRPRTDLNISSETFSYSILNYYQKGTSKKVLVSCPNLVQNWKEGKQNRQLAILKAHYSRHQQSCLWIDESSLEYYFSHVMVGFVKQGAVRSDLKMKFKLKNERQSLDHSKSILRSELYSKSIFFKLKLENAHDQPILLQLTDLQTRKRFDLSQLQGWKNQGHEIMLKQDEYPSCPELIKLTCSRGEYLCKFDLKAEQPKDTRTDISRRSAKRKKTEEQSVEYKKQVQLNLGPQHLREIQLTTWAPEQIQLMLLEESFGTIQWLAQYKNYVRRNWNMLTDRGQSFLSETVNGKTMFIALKGQPKRALLKLPKETCGAEAVEQGRWVEAQQQITIEMLNDEETRYVYCVLIGIPKIQTLKQVKVWYSF